MRSIVIIDDPADVDTQTLLGVIRSTQHRWIRSTNPSLPSEVARTQFATIHVFTANAINAPTASLLNIFFFRDTLIISSAAYQATALAIRNRTPPVTGSTTVITPTAVISAVSTMIGPTQPPQMNLLGPPQMGQTLWPSLSLFTRLSAMRNLTDVHTRLLYHEALLTHNLGGQRPAISQLPPELWILIDSFLAPPSNTPYQDYQSRFNRYLDRPTLGLAPPTDGHRAPPNSPRGN